MSERKITDEFLHNLGHVLEPFAEFDDVTIEAGNLIEMVNEMLAARREQGGVQEWQPMETAPKDGSAILIFDPEGKRNHHMPDEARGEREFTWKLDDPRMVHFDDKRYAIGYWRPAWGGGWGNRNDSKPTPTHWMPLPEPPAATPKDVEEGGGL